MIPFFPRQIANKAIAIYIAVLGFVTVFFYNYAMGLEYIFLGVVWVTGFFLLTSECSRMWKDMEPSRFTTTIVFTALGIRLFWVIFSYFFYLYKTGQPFEFEAADSLGYWEDGAWLSTESWSVVKDYLFTSRDSVSDSGYLLYLSFLCRLIGPGVLPTRLVKAFLSAATVLLVYHLSRRSFGEEVGKLAAIMACFMPNLVVYCGLHLKETEMLFLTVAFLERSDYLLRSRKYNVLTIAIPALLLLSLFTFRTVLGIAAVFAFVTAVVFTTTSVIGRGKRVMLIVWIAIAAAVFAGGTIVNESEGLWEERNSNLETKRLSQTLNGNQWAKYATGTVMAPMMFVLPFPTLVNVDNQYNQQILSGGNYVRNFLGGFVLLAVFSSVFVIKNWRDLSLLGAFAIAYLGIISMSGFSNSERFLLPGLPVLLIMAAYGITLLNGRNYRLVKTWYWIVPLMVVGWALFKLGSRGLL